METYQLKLFKHPNTPDQGVPVDVFDIEAETHEEADAKAVEIINGAPKQAFEDERDVFVLFDEEGHEIARWAAHDA